jgi:hypothetical protein
MDFKGSGCGLTEVLFQNLLGETEENNAKPESEQPVS